MDTYTSSAGEMLRNHLNENSTLGDSTRALIAHYTKIRGGSLTNQITNKMAHKSCMLSQIKSLHNEGITLYGTYKKLHINTNNNTSDPRLINQFDNSGRDKQLKRELNLNIFTPLWEDLGIYMIDELMNEKGTHLISVPELKLMYPGIKSKHTRALRQLYILLCKGRRYTPPLYTN
jgi:hypothetical protein